MLLKFVPDAVLSSGTLWREAQLLNMLVKSTVEFVSNWNCSSFLWLIVDKRRENVPVLCKDAAQSSQPVAYVCNPVWLCFTANDILVSDCPDCGVTVIIACRYPRLHSDPASAAAL